MSSLYHEAQLSSLCGVHALNNLLQGPFFGAGDLASYAHQLDEAEAALMTQSWNEAAQQSQQSHRIDVRTGDFSLDVLAKALESRGISLINVDHASVAEAVGSQPEREEGFLVHRSSHWFALRQVSSLWWSLDSKLPRPKLISHEALGPYISRLRVDGHTLHVARSTALGPVPSPLPSPQEGTGAGHEAVYHPIDYLLQYPSLDPNDSSSYAPIPTDAAQEAEDAMAAAALMEADAIAESERTAAAMQAREWGSGEGGGAADPFAGEPNNSGGADAASYNQMNLIRRQKQLYERTQQQSAAAETAARIMQQLSNSSSVGTPIGDIPSPGKGVDGHGGGGGVDADAMLAAQLMAQELEELDLLQTAAAGSSRQQASGGVSGGSTPRQQQGQGGRWPRRRWRRWRCRPARFNRLPWQRARRIGQYYEPGPLRDDQLVQEERRHE